MLVAIITNTLTDKIVNELIQQRTKGYNVVTKC